MRKKIILYVHYDDVCVNLLDLVNENKQEVRFRIFEYIFDNHITISRIFSVKCKRGDWKDSHNFFFCFSMLFRAYFSFRININFTLSVSVCRFLFVLRISFVLIFRRIAVELKLCSVAREKFIRKVCQMLLTYFGILSREKKSVKSSF